MNLWAIPRATIDIGLNVFADPEEYPKILDTLIEAGCTPTRAGGDWSPEAKAHFVNCAHEGEVAGDWRGDVRIDIFVPSIPFYADAARTVRHVVFAPDGRPRPVLSPESLAVFKLLFFRDKDVGDLRRLVAVQGQDLDVAWVRARVVEIVDEDDHRLPVWDDIVTKHRGGGSGIEP
jgi:hypothetical protein